MGYNSSFEATIYWNAEGADIYSPEDIYMFSANRAPLSSKSETEATHDSHAALAHYERKSEQFDQMVDGFTLDIEDARQTMFRSYEFNVQDEHTKEDYNLMMEQCDEAKYNRTQAKRQAKDERAAERDQKKAVQIQQQAVVDYHKKHISDLSKYTK